MLRQKLQQKLLQKLSPQQIQMIKLLEIPSMQLEQRIKKEIEENPALEEGADENSDQSIDEVAEKEERQVILDEYEYDDIPSYKLNANNYSKPELKPDIPFSVGFSFHDYLENQLGLRDLDEETHELALYLIGNLDDDGYLRRKLEAIVDDLAFSQNIKTDEFKLLEILRIIQDFEPSGVGARDLQECLILQIQAKDISIPEVALARKILKHHFDEFTKKHFDRIIDRLNITEQQLKEAVDEILKLNPRPGSGYSDPHSKVSEHVIPDFVLENEDGELQLSLNSRNVPELRVSKTYNEMFETYSGGSKGRSGQQQKDAASFVKHKLDSARWFIDAIKQRQNTLMVTMEAIIEYQKEYFQEGDEKLLRPMILKDIADKTGLDISTISRVANSKYVQTHFGIYPLKYFFSEGMQTDSGEEVSTREIKKILEECIAIESKKKPLTDDELAEILQKKGYQIARRTVAKYREQLNIPVARLRKELL
jgi:RNA polymerase sigma-54 factor